MSIWTQVVGNLVVSQNGKDDGIKKIEELFGPMSTWSNYVDESTLPLGTEGNMQYFFNEKDNGDLQVLLVGSLRDQDNEDEVSTWIENFAQPEDFADKGLKLLSGVVQLSIDDFYEETNFFNELSGKWFRETQADIDKKEYIGDKTSTPKIEVTGAVQLDNFSFLSRSKITTSDLLEVISNTPRLDGLEWQVIENGSNTSMQRFSLVVSGVIDGPIDEDENLTLLISAIDELAQLSQQVRTGIFMTTPVGEAPVIATNVGDSWLYFK